MEQPASKWRKSVFRLLLPLLPIKLCLWLIEAPDSVLINSMLTWGQIVLRADTKAFMGFLKGEFYKHSVATLGKFPQFLHKCNLV